MCYERPVAVPLGHHQWLWQTDSSWFSLTQLTERGHHTDTQNPPSNLLFHTGDSTLTCWDINWSAWGEPGTFIWTGKIGVLCTYIFSGHWFSVWDKTWWKKKTLWMTVSYISEKQESLGKLFNFKITFFSSFNYTFSQSISHISLKAGHCSQNSLHSEHFVIVLNIL